MNIRDYWPTQTDKFENTPATWKFLLELRRSTYAGFAGLEKTKGFLQPKASINSASGQEMVRILMFRTLEEISESYLAEDLDHIREEAVDAMNYLLAVHAIDPVNVPEDQLIETLMKAADRPDNYWNVKPWRERIGEITILVAGELGDVLRNRSWMNNAQDTYFSGQTVLHRVFYEVAEMLMITCVDFDQFVRYFIAKDEVLKFRLRSNY